MQNELHIRTSVKTVFLLLLIIFYCGVCMLPYIPLSIVRVGQLATMVVFLLLILFSSKTKIQKRICSGILIYFALILFYWGIGYSTASIGNYFFQISFLFSILITFYIIKKLPRSHLIIIFLAVVILTIIHVVFDIVMGSIFEGLPEKELEELGINITSFNTTALIVLCTLLILFLNTKIRFYSILLLSLIAVFFYYIVFYGQRGSVTIYLLLALLLIFYEKFSNKKRVTAGVRVIPILLLLILLWVCRDSILSFLMQISPNERLTERLVDLKGTVNNGVSEDSFSGRLSLEMVSLKSWLRDIVTFFIGIGDHRLEGDFGFEGFALSGIGGHSELIDSLARYGIIGFSLLIYIYVNIYKYIVSLFLIPTVKKQVKSLLIIGVLIAITKVVSSPEIGIAFFIFLPLSSILLNKQKYRI